MRNKVALAAVFICAMGADDARAHCFAHWFYPWPQRCGGSYRPPPIKRIYAPDFIVPTPRPKEIEIPIPNMDFEPAGEPDARTAGMLLLRAKLEEPSKGETEWQKTVKDR